MLRNYLKVAVRNLLKNKSQLLINALGMGIAIACCLTAYLFVGYNIEFDSFHSKAKTRDIYRLHSHVKSEGQDPRQVIGAPYVVGPMAAQDFSGIKRYLRYALDQVGVSYGSNSSEEIKSFYESVAFADSTLFDMFDFPLASGSHEAFKDKYSVFIDQERASKYFGEENPIGKTLTLSFTGGVAKQFTVAGVVKDIPLNSSIHLPIVIRFEIFEEIRNKVLPTWQDWMLPAIFFDLESPDRTDQTAALFMKFAPLRNEVVQQEEVFGYSLEPFHSALDAAQVQWSFLGMPIDTRGVFVFVALAVMILFVGCFNLANTSLAMAVGRLKEIGLRRVSGATSRQVMTQFLLETLLIVVLSTVVAWLISRAIVPEFTAMWGMPYGLEDLSGLNLMLTILVLVLVVSVLSGLFPSLLSARVQTVNLLKGYAKVQGFNLFSRSLVAL
ncbi:MAG: ABC transporter permease, partial [Bacteroidota bacterium]